MDGLVLDDTGFELVIGGERVGPRRVVGLDDVRLLEKLSARYVLAVDAGSDMAVLVELGRELFSWLDGGQGQLAALLERASAPVVFEVRGPRSPSACGVGGVAGAVGVAGVAGWRVCGRGCVAAVRCGAPAGCGDAGRRRLDGFRLGLAFMAASPRSAAGAGFRGRGGGDPAGGR